MPSENLDRYRAKRDFTRTSEPEGAPTPAGDGELPRFVVQEHHATRLHWDLRLEHDGALASWAIPNGIPPDRHENRLAVHTEDHPLEYLDFEGEIPRGEYGAGTMSVWDRGAYELHKWEPRKVEVTFHGERLTGRYGLFPIGRAGEESAKNDWMIHRMDPPQDPDRVPLPAHVEPMLARPGKLPADTTGFSYEVKWDGVRALAYVQPGRLRLESRNLRDITGSYPELRGLLRQTGMRELLLDGEIVAFDEAGRPSFSRLQRRMHVSAPAAVKRLSAEVPVVYAIFDLLHLDGRSLLREPYATRRRALLDLGFGGPAWRVPAAHGDGAKLLAATAEQGLEGVVAKRTDSFYDPGRRSTAWTKVKNTRRQELVIGGWIPGEGRRAERIGALLMGYHDGGAFRFAGRVGTGFTQAVLEDLERRLAPLRTEANPFAGAPKLPREACFVTPELVAEVEFVEWTPDGVMRAPSYKGLREDKPARDVVLETPPAPGDPETAARLAAGTGAGGAPGTPEALFDKVEKLPDGALAVRAGDRGLKLTNWDKVLFPQAGFTKGDLIAFYARIAPAVLPHLLDRALTLKRYPSGVDAPYFYEKQSPSHRPEWVRTVRIGDVDYTVAESREALDLARQPGRRRAPHLAGPASAPDRPTMVVFDLDPGPPAGLLECGEVGLVLRGLFSQLGLESFVKTSGSKGMQVYVPLNTDASYAQTKTFARTVAELLEARLPKLVVSRMTKSARRGKILVDWSQNDAHKTTVTVYSVRARERPTVSTPVSWEEVAEAREAGDPGRLVFETDAVLERVERDGDLFAPLVSLAQRLPSL